MKADLRCPFCKQELEIGKALARFLGGGMAWYKTPVNFFIRIIPYSGDAISIPSSAFRCNECHLYVLDHKVPSCPRCGKLMENGEISESRCGFHWDKPCQGWKAFVPFTAEFLGNNFDAFQCKSCDFIILDSSEQYKPL